MRGKRSEEGVLYIALGIEFLAMALRSATTLRQQSPQFSIAIVTNVTPRRDGRFAWTEGLVDHWEHVAVAAAQNRTIKLSMYEHSPFARTLYLDADTEVLEDISPMFRWLEHADLAMHLQPRGNRPRFSDVDLGDGTLVRDLPHWNSGVVIFRRSEAAREFFATWQAEFLRLGQAVDQVALASTMLRTPARTLAFDARWNCPPSTLRKHSWRHLGGVRIMHYMHSMPASTYAECLEILDRVARDPAVAVDATHLRDGREALARRAAKDRGNAHPRRRALKELARAARGVLRAVPARGR